VDLGYTSQVTDRESDDLNADVLCELIIMLLNVSKLSLHVDSATGRKEPIPAIYDRHFDHLLLPVSDATIISLPIHHFMSYVSNQKRTPKLPA